ncbi:MAG: hypothetical protein AB1861_00925 [Cyanobacteriota bacterium]
MSFDNLVLTIDSRPLLFSLATCFKFANCGAALAEEKVLLYRVL